MRESGIRDKRNKKKRAGVPACLSDSIYWTLSLYMVEGKKEKGGRGEQKEIQKKNKGF